MPGGPGMKVWEWTTAVTTGASPVVSPFFPTDGYSNLFVECLFTNSTGTTTLTVEGSFDGSTLDATMTYGAGISATNTPAGVAVPVMHSYVRFRIVQATANATATEVFVQSRA